MFVVSTSTAVAIGLSALASFFATFGANDPSSAPQLLPGEQATAVGIQAGGRLPRFIQNDNHFLMVASAIPLASPTRTLQNILSISSGCPGTGSLTGTFSGSDIQLVASGLPSSVFSLFLYGPPLGNPVPFYDGTLCAHWGLLQRRQVALTTPTGTAQLDGTIQPNAGANTVSVQCFYRVPPPLAVYGGNLSDGLIVDFEPLP